MFHYDGSRKGFYVENNVAYENFHSESGEFLGCQAYDKATEKLESLWKGKTRATYIADRRDFPWYESECIALKRQIKGMKDSEIEFTGGASFYEIALQQKQEKRERRNKKKEKEVNEQMKKIKPCSKAFENFCNTTLFDTDETAYIFMKKGGKTGKCTRCGKEVEFPKKKHLSEGRCPNCNKKVVFLLETVRKKIIYDSLGTMMFQKVNKDEIVARYFCCYRRIEDVDAPEISVLEKARWFFKENQAELYFNRSGRWKKQNPFQYSDGHNDYYYMGRFEWNLPGKAYKRSFSCLKGTFVERKGFLNTIKKMSKEENNYYLFHIYGKELALSVRKRYALACEYMSKSGFHHLVTSLYDTWGYDSKLDYDQNSLIGMMRVDKPRYRELLHREEEIKLDISKLGYIQNFPKLSLDEILRMYGKVDVFSAKEILKYCSVKKMLRYVEQGNSPIEWSDYIKLSITAGEFDKHNSMILFPKYLESEHKRLQERVREIKNKEAHERREKALKAIDNLLLGNLRKQYEYKDKNFALILPKEAHDIVTEGQVQHICVGNTEQSYISDMAEGKTVIAFLRRSEEMEKPFYTIEIKNNSIRQVRGFANKSATDDVQEFMEKYAAKKGFAYN